MDRRPHSENSAETEGIFGDEDSHILLSQIEKYAKNFSVDEWDRIQKSIEVTIELYKDEERRDGTLSLNHKLRAGLNTLELFETRDADIVCAAFLHDTVEDFVEHKHAESYTDSYLFLNEVFGENVMYLVKSVTAENVDGLSEENARKYYWDYFENAIQDPDVFYVKLADFLDNGTNFINMPEEYNDVKVRTAQKYLPMYALCIERLQKNDISIPKQNKMIIAEMLEVGRKNALAIIENNS